MTVEELNLSKYESPRYRPSELVPGLLIEKDPALTCPRCGKTHDDFRPFVVCECRECGLFLLKLRGNVLYISDTANQLAGVMRDHVQR